MQGEVNGVTAETEITAALVVIGDEILSGRTKDSNIGTLADYLTDLGIDLREVRIVGDRREAIIDAVNALRAAYDEVFTTGGIGPTHDDITAEAVAAAFGVSLFEDPRAVEMMQVRYGKGTLNEARRKMACVPEGARLIVNDATAAPGFTIGNVHVLAGVPTIMKSMLAALAPELRKGVRMQSTTIPVAAPEGAIAAEFGVLQARFPDVAMGSYPQMGPEGFRTELVLRSRSGARLAEAEAAVREMVGALAGDDAEPGRAP